MLILYYFNFWGSEACLIKRIKILFLLCLIIFPLSDFVYPQSNIDNLFYLLEKSNYPAQKDILEKILLSITDIDTAIAKRHTERLLKLTVKFKNPFCYNHSLLFYSRFGSPSNRKNILFTTYRLAKDADDIDLMARTQIALSEVYKEENRYDSSIVSIIKARDLFEKTNNQNEQVTVLHKIGDLYYLAGLYDRAEKYFKEVRRLKGEPKAWRDWREYVITNNLGLIEKGRKNYDSAINYFNKALNDLYLNKKHILNYMDTIRIVYSYTSLADLYIYKKNYNKAWDLVEKACFAESKYMRPEHMIKLYLIKGKLFYYKANYDSSLFYLNKAKSIEQCPNSLELSPAIYNYMSGSYSKLNDFKNAWIAKNKFIQVSDSLLKKKNIYSGVQFISDNFVNKAETVIDKYKVKEKYLFGIILIVSLSIILILFIFFRLKNSYQQLIKKNIELMNADINIEELKLHLRKKKDKFQKKLPEKNEMELLNLKVEGNDEDIHSQAKMKNFATQLDEEMTKRQLFVDQNITLDSLAHLLNTNRNYLSKVINDIFGKNFNSYINELRIKKSILIISKKEGINFYTLDGIAQTVGFHNRTTFISAFKKYTGVTPSLFIKNMNSSR